MLELLLIFKTLKIPQEHKMTPVSNLPPPQLPIQKKDKSAETFFAEIVLLKYKMQCMQNELDLLAAKVKRLGEEEFKTSRFEVFSPTPFTPSPTYVFYKTEKSD